MRSFQLLLGSAAILSSAVAALDPIVVKGQKFFNSKTGEQFFMKGIAYQQDLKHVDQSMIKKGQLYVDPITNMKQLKVDLPKLKELKTNTIRIYQIDPEDNHDAGMKLLADAGIYVIADLPEPGMSINRDDPMWDKELFNRHKAVVDVLAKYDNTLGFFAGNEVSNMVNNTGASAFVKAAIRDTKAYIKEKGYRTIPVGYATNDDKEIRYPLADYFNCGPEDEAADFWGYNIYSWCGKSSMKISGYDIRTEDFRNYSIPLFMAEYGCNEPRPRPFTDVAAIYGKEMSDVWSGGIVYMYFEEDNKYGLVTAKNGKVETNDDYDNYKEQILKVKPDTVSLSSYDASDLKPRQCPPVGDDWEASEVLPPTPNDKICSCMVKSVGCAPSKKAKTEDIGEMLGFICNEIDCDGISVDAAEGRYGAFSMCDPMEKLAWALDAYYKGQNEAEDACDFEGKAELQDADDTCVASDLKDVGGLAGDKNPQGTGSSSGGSKTNKDSAAVMSAPSLVALFLSVAAGVTSMMI